MKTNCEHCPLRKKDHFTPFKPEELRFMQNFKSGEMRIDPGTPLLVEGSNTPQLYTALRGMGVRYKTLENGRRQVVNFVFPGDFIGLQAGIKNEMGHSVQATTHMTLCVFDRTELWTLFKSSPERAFDLTWLGAIEEHFLGDALMTIGQRTALESVAWAMIRLFRRGEALGLTRDNTMPLPFKQQDIADALGLSLVHTNKTLAKLRDRQLASWTQGELQINDIETLAEVASMTLEPERRRPIM